MYGTRWLLAACLMVGLLAPANPLMADDESANAPPRPGIQVGERFLGFVPKHEQILTERGIPLSEATTQPTSRAELWTRDPSIEQLPSIEQTTGPDLSASSAVQSASYEAPLVEGSPCGCPGPCNGEWCGPFNKLPRFWGRAEYLYMWTKGSDVPGLATTSPDGTDQDVAGVLPDATTLFGGDSFHEGNSGGRFSMGMWLTPEATNGIEFSYLFIGEQSDSFSADQNDFGILARPFFNASLNEQDSRLIAFDGLVEGSLQIDAASEFDMWDLMLRRLHSCDGEGRTDMLYGLRRARLNDVIRFSEQTTSLSGPTLDSQFALSEQFATENEFYGAMIGFDYVGPAIDNWSLGILAKVAAGYSESTLDISGSTTITTDPDGTADTVTNDGGLLTQQSNIGRTKDHSFSTISEVGISMTRRWPIGLGVRFGYTFLLWHEVSRAGDEIDAGLNPTQIPPSTLTGDARPRRVDQRSNFWAQGITAALEYRF